MTHTPDASPRPGRNARWRVEWRVPGDARGDRLHVTCREVRGAVAVRALALGVGTRAVAGEFRLSAAGLQPLVVDLQRLRDWDPASALPASCPRALWSLELAEIAAAEDLRHAVRAATTAAISAGVLSVSDGAGLVRLAWALAGEGRRVP